MPPFTWHNLSGFIHVVTGISRLFFCIVEQYPIMNISQHFKKIYSPVNGHLGYFQFRIIIYKHAVSVHTQTSYGPTFSFYLSKYLGFGFLVYIVSIYVTLKETVKLLSIAAVLFFVSTSNE